MGSDGSHPERGDVLAARRGGDPEQRMTGEPALATSTLEQAIFWHQIYAEILAMEDKVLARVHELMLTETPTVRREVELSNLPILVAQAARFRQRHLFWSQRLEELRDGRPGATVGLVTPHMSAPVSRAPSVRKGAKHHAKRSAP